MFNWKIKIVSISLLFLVGFSAQAYYDLGKPTGFVNDYTNTLSQEEKTSLENKLVAFEQESSNEISVAIIDSLQGDYIENFAVKLFEEWGVGKADEDNGILLLVALEERKVRIEVGYGLEGALTDLESSKIIEDIIVPAFKQGSYSLGVSGAVDGIITATRGEYVGEGAPLMTTKNISRNFESIIWLLIMGFYALVALKRYLAKSKKWWEGGVIGAVIGGLVSAIFFSLAYMIIFVGAFTFAGLVFDFMVSRFKIFANKPIDKNKRSNIWFFGGPRGGSGGSGGGFGGFGGGFSGGGGSSGSW